MREVPPEGNNRLVRERAVVVSDPQNDVIVRADREIPGADGMVGHLHVTRITPAQSGGALVVPATLEDDLVALARPIEAAVVEAVTLPDNLVTLDELGNAEVFEVAEDDFSRLVARLVKYVSEEVIASTAPCAVDASVFNELQHGSSFRFGWNSSVEDRK